MGEPSVLDLAEQFAERHVAFSQQRSLVRTALRALRKQLEESGVMAEGLECVRVPRLVFTAAHGSDERCGPLITALVLLYAGIDLWDDVMDSDLAPIWQDYRVAEVSLTAATLFSGLAPLAMAGIPAAPATIVALQETLARGLLEMAGGQQLDVALTGQGTATAEVVELSVAGKSGAALGMFAELAARLADAPEERVAAYAEMGRALGMARQVRSDCYDVFVAPRSRDLAAGTRTLPIVLHLDRLAGAARHEFLMLLERARADPEAREAVHSTLRDASVLQTCAVVVESYCRRAQRALERALPDEPAGHALRALITAASFATSNPMRVRSAFVGAPSESPV